jgi:hypothetical protein
MPLLLILLRHRQLLMLLMLAQQLLARASVVEADPVATLLDQLLLLLLPHLLPQSKLRVVEGVVVANIPLALLLVLMVSVVVGVAGLQPAQVHFSKVLQPALPLRQLGPTTCGQVKVAQPRTACHSQTLMMLQWVPVLCMVVAQSVARARLTEARRMVPQRRRHILRLQHNVLRIRPT